MIDFSFKDRHYFINTKSVFCLTQAIMAVAAKEKMEKMSVHSLGNNICKIQTNRKSGRAEINVFLSVRQHSNSGTVVLSRF